MDLKKNHLKYYSLNLIYFISDDAFGTDIRKKHHHKVNNPINMGAKLKL